MRGHRRKIVAGLTGAHATLFVMPGHSSLLRADCVNLSAMPGIHVFLCFVQDVDGRDIWREDALRAFARP
jgi:hypothetical protein